MRYLLLMLLVGGSSLRADLITPSCDDAVPIWEGGVQTGMICASQAPRRGYTVLDLSDDWVPAVFDGVPYGSRIVALENAKFDGDDRARRDRFLELYGIFPSFSVLTARLDDDARHACHDAVVDDGDEMTLLQRHLVCEGFLGPGDVDGKWGGDTKRALGLFRREHMLVGSGEPDYDVWQAIAAGSRELAFRAVLRALRERVVDATGLIEDGSARNDWGTVLGRELDSSELRSTAGRPPLDNGAPDLISPATEAAARALGWTDYDSARRWLDGHETASLKVAVRLPPPPSTHTGAMELRAVIDRGDVWYDYPAKNQPVDQRPVLILYDGDTPLIRWPTTIGGWQREADGDDVGYRYKESPTGDFVWAQIVAAPVWLPPDTTPDDELGSDGYVDQGLLGPGYASAFGLVAMVHVDPATGADTAIRTHGSVNYNSILHDHSHGCHRLFNHLALRLGGFLLAHRVYLVEGDSPVDWERPVFGHRVHRETRGFIYDLYPPVPVTVLPGTIKGDRQRAFFSLQPTP